jgi:hypothetical protein
LNSLFGLIAVIISVAVGFGTLRRRANEPTEKRWEALETWKDGVDKKLDRDYRAINRADRRMGRHQDFESLMLRSMTGLIEHLASGNHANELKEISRQIKEYLLSVRADADAGDDI